MPQQRLPRWMKAQMPKGNKYSEVFKLVKDNDLHTICTSGNCPNRGECWNAGTASFMILGNICSRNCRFCDVMHGMPGTVDSEESLRLAKAIKTLDLKHAVITSVTRDDLPDGGSGIWADTIREIKKENPDITIEALIPDMKANKEHLQIIVDSNPEVISHNIETVRRLTPEVRSAAMYDRSLEVLKYISDSGIVAKSGIMLGLGESADEVMEALHDLRSAGVTVVTIGQYLQPREDLHPVIEYISPEIFNFFETEGLRMGFSFVESSPMVRSSYHAEKHAAK